MLRHYPQTKDELKSLVNDLSINLGDIETCLITDMSGLFSGTERTDFSGIESWDTSNVTNMSWMFCRAEHFNENINSWNVSKVEYMNRMFEGAINFNQPLNSWNVSNVNDMESMFMGANNFNQPLDKWDISSVERMLTMFFCAKKFNQNLDSWNVNDPIAYRMFVGSPLQSNPPKWYKP